MQEKVVKFEIGKVLAVVIAVIAVAALAGVALQSNMFQGNLTAGQVKELCLIEPENSLCAKLDEREISRLKECDYNQAELEEMSGRPALTRDQRYQLKICLEALLTPITLNEKDPVSITPELVQVDGKEENVSITPELVQVDGKEENVSITPELVPVDGKEENVSITPVVREKEPATTNPDPEEKPKE